MVRAYERIYLGPSIVLVSYWDQQSIVQFSAVPDIRGA